MMSPHPSATAPQFFSSSSHVFGSHSSGGMILVPPVPSPPSPIPLPPDPPLSSPDFLSLAETLGPPPQAEARMADRAIAVSVVQRKLGRECVVMGLPERTDEWCELCA